MKRLIIFLLFFSQVLFVFNNFVIPTENTDTSNVTPVVQISHSMLLKIVYSNLLETLKSVVEIGCLVSSLPFNSQKSQNKQTNKDNVVIHLYNQFNFSTARLKNIVNNCINWLKFFVGKDNVEFSSIKMLFLFYIWFLFFYLQKIQFYFLKPRCSIGHILFFNRGILLDNNLYLTGVNINPNWRPGFPGFQLGFFLFYKVLLTFDDL